MKAQSVGKTSRARRRLKWAVGIIVAIALLGYLGLFAASWACGEIDFRRVQNGQRPRFAKFETMYLDGGSNKYRGLCYELIEYRAIVLSYPIFQREVGPEIEYTCDAIWPILGRLRNDRKMTRIVSESQVNQ